MLPEIDALLRRSGGVATRGRLLTVVSRSALDRETRTGRLVSPFARVWCRPWDADQPTILDRAALMSVGTPAALDRRTALRRWDLVDEPAQRDTHVAVPVRRSPRRQAGLVVHRVMQFPPVVRMDGLIVTSAAEAVVTSWADDDGPDRRGPAIAATRAHLAAPAELRAALERHPRLPRRRELAELVGLLADGCESELEIWGHLHVFDGPGLRHGLRQREVWTGGRRYRLDLAFDAERVAVELDGARFHSTREQRERDLRRDAVIAASAG